MRMALISSLVLITPTWAQGLTASVAARVALPLPLAPLAADPAIDALRFEPVREALHALEASTSVVLTDVALPGGGVVDLELERISIDRLHLGFEVDGTARPELRQRLSDVALTLWTGRVAGAADSEVMLSFSLAGSRGWIRDGARLVHLLPRPSRDGNWSRGDVLFASDETVTAFGLRFDGQCEADRAAQLRSATRPALPRAATGANPSPPRLAPAVPGSAALGGASCPLRECQVAITSDFQFYQKFNDLTAQTTYVTTLLGFVSNRYETQAGTILTFPYVAFYTTAADPWLAPDNGGSSVDMLNELQAAWNNNIPAGANLGHLMSGAALGGGVAWLDVLCNAQFGFGVSGNMNGTISFPIVQQPNNWDFIVVSHEIGHNFNALHTHDYCPPLDQCPPTQYFGACQTAQVCINTGTIMSYCHLCSGGTANVTTFFHTQSAADMTAASDICLPCYYGISGDAPLNLTPNAATALTARVNGTPTAGVQLLWRAGTSGAFNALAMANTSGNTWSATLPAFACGQTVQFYYSFDEATIGMLNDPSTGAGNPYQASVSVPTTLSYDNFETDLGWTTSVAGATSGQWERGVPVNDAGWAYDPASDGDGSGQCWLTQNAPGNTDVDGGAVTLVSPVLDMSAANASLEFRYYLRLTVTDGADRLLVEASSNGLAGPWTAIATHTGDTGGVWATSTITNAQLAILGVTLGSNMRLRFTANDSGAASIVEAGVDGLAIRGASCPSFQPFCAGDGSLAACPCGNNGASGAGCANSSFAAGATLSASGIASVASDSTVLASTNLTGSVAVFFQGATQTSATIIDDGLGCVGGPIVRLGTQPVAGSASSYPQGGNPSISVRGAIPAVGGTYSYQCFYRNAVAAFCPPATSNRTNGVQITWAP